MIIDKLKDILRDEGCSCVVYNGEIRTFHQRGVKDIYSLLASEPEFLRGAIIADKIIGRAAAAILITGGVKELFTFAISQSALALLEKSDIELSYDKVIPHISNRTGDGVCPMESACSEVSSAHEAVEILRGWRFPDGTVL